MPVDWSEVASATAHRPWPLPERPWVMTMSWLDLLFAHWRVPAEQVASRLPAGLEVDTFEGDAWVGVVPFWMDNVTGRWLPNVPGLSRFPELNVRTYVTDGRKPGVWFFSLDADQRLAVWGARTFFDLPYVRADMHCTKGEDGWVRYESHRTDDRMAPGAFEGRYRGVGDVYRSQPGSLDAWLTERYCLYSADDAGRVGRGEIQHVPWPLQKAEAQIDVNTVADAHGFTFVGEPLLHFVERIDVVGWTLEGV
ncbi:MAG: YqjF family protein [Nannocystaceae bacterium]|nr:DUF2071 domain-containing protein [bacterium]